MDPAPKRRVLSLSLSQPSKQHKKLRIKRYPSASSENASNNSQTNEPQEVDTPRDNESSNSPLQSSMSLAMCNNQSKSPPTSSQNEHNSVSEASENCKGMHLSNPECGLTESTASDQRKICLEKPLSKVSNVGNEDTILDTSRLMDHSSEASKRVFEEDLNLSKEKRTPVFFMKSKNISSEVRVPESCTGVSSAMSKHDLSVDSGPSNEKVASETSSNQAHLEVLQCPLCYKKFDKLPPKTAHVKGCALKHKVSTHQLIEVLELQRKQTAERRALGLPAIPSAAGNAKKPTAPRKEYRATSKIDNNLQLAMALSLSLQDQQQPLDTCQKTEGSIGLSLDHFGFTSKAVLDAVQPRPSTSHGRGKIKSSAKKASALLTRTPEERQRIITEKVAMVLLEEVVAEENEIAQSVLKSSFLKEAQNKETMLWAKSHVSPSKSDRTSYYVDSLRGFISPSKVEMGSKVMHLSQVVGRVTTPKKDPKNQEPAEEAQTSSLSEEDVSSDSCSEPTKSKTPSHLEMELRAKFFNDWAGMVNNPSMSDLAIYPKEGREIPTHKIVLHVRCSRILRDISRQRNTLTGNEVEVIMWSKTPHAAALAFLEYIYCGSVKSIRVLSKDLSSIIWLANHYRISDLIRYLKALAESSQTSETPSQVALKVVSDTLKTSSCSKSVLEITDVSEVLDSEEAKDGLHSSKELRDNSDSFPPKQPKILCDASSSPTGTQSRSETESIYSEATLAEPENRSQCSSPDMFDDEDFLEVSQGELQAGEQEDDNTVAADKQKCDTVKEKNLRSEFDRTPSRLSSVSSDKTVCMDKNASKFSPCASISSEKTDLIENDCSPLSPALSQASAATEVLDFNESVSRKASISLNDSKRKLSDSSQGNDTCKRSCPISPSYEAEPNRNDSDIEFFDLTQDSDSNASFPVINKNFSGDSCEKVLISSGHDVSDVESIGRQSTLGEDTNHKKEDVEINCTPSNPNENESGVSTLNAKSMEEAGDAYISPVWDGFEDMNYEDPFLFLQPPVSDMSLANERMSPAKQSSSSSEERGLSPLLENQTISLAKKRSSNKTHELDLGDERKSSSSSDCEVTYHSPVVTKKSNPSHSGFEALLDESLNINDSFLRKAETGIHVKLSQKETKGTPLNRILTTEIDVVTPLANYSAMKTPQLKRELQKFGLKPTLGKRKGKIMLRHIYNELHPWVPVENDGPNVSEQTSLSQPSSSGKHTFSSSQPNSRKLTFSDTVGMDKNIDDNVDDELEKSDSDSDSDASGGTLNTSMQEIRFLEGDCDEAEILSQAIEQPVGKANLAKIVYEFITHDKELHQRVLEYEPIWIEKLQSDLRSNGFKFKMQDLMAFLDEKCITFRTNQGGPRTKKRKERNGTLKKKTAGSKLRDSNQLSDSE